MSKDSKPFTLHELRQRRETYTLCEWDDNSLDLYWNVANFKIPEDPVLRKQYLFDRCHTYQEETFLMNIYERWFEGVHREILIFRKMAMIHEASVQNRLGKVIFSLFHDYPEALQQLTEWEEQHPHIFLYSH
jgi:hypothetical protein